MIPGVQKSHRLAAALDKEREAHAVGGAIDRQILDDLKWVPGPGVDEHRYQALECLLLYQVGNASTARRPAPREHRKLVHRGQVEADEAALEIAVGDTVQATLLRRGMAAPQQHEGREESADSCQFAHLRGRD